MERFEIQMKTENNISVEANRRKKAQQMKGKDICAVSFGKRNITMMEEAFAEKKHHKRQFQISLDELGCIGQ